MAKDKQPMQADGAGSKKGAPDGVRQPHAAGSDAAGESAGGAYPNPHQGKKPIESPGDFLGHGGQTEMDYYGPGQLGGKKADRKAKPGERVGQGGRSKS